MENLIKALQILLKYDNPDYPTSCEHDILRIYVDPKLVSNDDIDKLEDLGIDADDEHYCFYSYKYGSC